MGCPSSLNCPLLSCLLPQQASLVLAPGDLVHMFLLSLGGRHPHERGPHLQGEVSCSLLKNPWVSSATFRSLHLGTCDLGLLSQLGPRGWNQHQGSRLGPTAVSVTRPRVPWL